MTRSRSTSVVSFLFVLLASIQNAEATVSAKVFMEDATLTDSTKESPMVYIKNTGTDTIKNFYFYYYFTTEQGAAPNLGMYYLPNTTDTLQKLDSVNYRIKFLVSGWPLKPNDSLFEEQFAIFYDYVKKVNKSNDYSYIASGSFTEDNKIPVFLVTGDSLVYGILPNTLPKPVPKFSGMPTAGTDSLKVQFTDSSTGAITSRLWTFGDNSTDTSKNPLHNYITSGSFSVKLVVSGPGGKDSVIKPNYIVISSSVPKPVPKFSGTPTVGTDSLKVQFTDSSTGTITSRLWDFGDNTTDTSKNPLHNYTKVDTYTVKLVVTGPGGKDSLIDSNYIKISASIPKPRANFSGAPRTGQDSLIVQFYDSSTGTITSRLWNFGDNTTDTSKNPVHDYEKSGIFSVNLVVIGPGGKDSFPQSSYINITASIPKPKANFSYAPTSGTDSLKVQFYDSSTGTITSRLWSFGDNSTDTSKNPLHDYLAAGSFSVKLVVSGPGGKDSVTSPNRIVIIATIPKPKANFSGTPTTGTDSLKVQFTDSSTGTITSRLWTFGDNSTDTSKNPLHDYITTGSFSVKLVVSGPGGKDSVTRTNYITIIPSIDTTTVVNTIQIKKITFDPVANAIKIFWTKDSTQSKNYTIGIYCSASGYPADTGAVKQIAPGNLPSDSASIALGKSIMFNTTYYVAMWLKKSGGPWTVPIKDSIITPSYTWQGIVYFRPDSVRDTVYAFNKRIRIVTDIPFDSITDTLIAWPAPADAAKNGFIPVSVGFYFKQQSAQSPYFYVGIACDSIPKKYSIASVRIYQYVGGCWTVEQSSGADAANNIVYVKTRDRADPFIAMIDAVPPLVTPAGKADGPALSDQPIVDTVMVSDNICNMQCIFRYAKGANSYSEGDSVDTILNSKSDTLVFAIPGSAVSEDAGVRAMFIASDGANADTVNFSRQVIRGKQSDAVTTDALQWMPLHVTAMPDSPSAQFALRNFAVNGVWKYDPTAFRMFRWFPYSLNVGATDKWIEYSDAQKNLFSFAPGTVFWLKTRQQGLIDFGSAETPSLIASFPVTLQPNDWTDIAVPYKFNVIIGDILTATAAAGQPADSLQWYQWGLDTNKHYATKPVYVQGLSDINLDFGNTENALVSNPFVGYSVFNPYNHPVQLSIPPVPVSMSAIGLPKKTAKKLAQDSWAIRVLGRTWDGTPLCPVYCGHAPGKEKGRDFFSAPPQLDNIAIRVCDAKKNLFGHEIVRGLLDEGGASFDLAIVNGAAALSAVEYGFETVNALPRGMQAMLVDLQTGALSSIEKPLVASVNGGERAYLRLAVGGKEYLSKIKLEARLWRLDLLDAFPNPFGRQVRIRYTLPAAGIGRVKLSVLGVSGKTVFETTRAPGMAAGVQEFLWDGTDGRKNRVGTGVYVLRMTAFDEKAKIAGIFERKITCLP